MSEMPCVDCYSEDRKINYEEFPPCQYPCCYCNSRKFKHCNKELCKFGVSFVSTCTVNKTTN